MNPHKQGERERERERKPTKKDNKKQPINKTTQIKISIKTKSQHNKLECQQSNQQVPLTGRKSSNTTKISNKNIITLALNKVQ